METSKQRILAVDDEVHMLKLLERIITEKTPYAIEITNSSLEVPKILEDRSFDVVISDLKMPGLDGLDLLRLIKEQQREEEVIIITAFGSLETAIEALSKGVFDYITKPFRKEQIIFTVDRAMRWQRSKREMRRLDEIFNREPYTLAQQAFGVEYLQRLSDRYGGDRVRMAERAGLSQEALAAALAAPGAESK